MSDITKKDVYGQSQEGREDPTFADSFVKYYPELAYMEFNPHDFAKAWAPFTKPKTNTMIDLKRFLTFLRGLAFLTSACFLCIIAAKIVVSFTVFVWHLF